MRCAQLAAAACGPYPWPCCAPQGGRARLPVSVTDKTDTFKQSGEGAGSFRLKAVAVSGMGQAVPGIPPLASVKIVVKTQRALNDYRKNEYPCIRWGPGRATRRRRMGGDCVPPMHSGSGRACPPSSPLTQQCLLPC